jgi:hypothetical protein
MDQQAKSAGPSPQAVPTVLPDVATEPHPTPHAVPPEPGAGEGLLQATLPEITEVAKKVGGFENLSKIAEELAQQQNQG